MSQQHSDAYLTSLVREFCKLPQETGWVEFKENDASAQEIGEYISALSNAATLTGKGFGYLVWGISDKGHEITGTAFKPMKEKVGNEDLESWLLRMLSPKLHFHFHSFELEGKQIVLLEIPAASGKPTSFSNIEYTRIGSYKKSMKDYPEQERALWRAFDKTPFEELIAAANQTSSDVLRLLDYPAYFLLMSLPQPSHEDGIMASLEKENMVRRNDAGLWEITNLGAILFARDLHSFKGLSRKALRLIIWEGTGRFKTTREQLGQKGYASGFEGLIEFLTALLPRNEVIGKALRREVPMYPDLAVRELIANALIHQDFSITGAGPMVEVFVDRMEITNPGCPLVFVCSQN